MALGASAEAPPRGTAGAGWLGRLPHAAPCEVLFSEVSRQNRTSCWSRIDAAGEAVAGGATAGCQ